MSDLDWLSDELVRCLKWQLVSDGRETPDSPEVPLAGGRIWSLFLALCKTRGAGGFGPSPITHQEIDAYTRLHGDPVRPFELEILAALDTAYLETARRIQSGDIEPQAGVSSREMTPALFDALFGGGEKPQPPQRSLVKQIADLAPNKGRVR